MMQCGTCNHWVHAKCEDLTGDFFFFLNLNLSFWVSVKTVLKTLTYLLSDNWKKGSQKTAASKRKKYVPLKTLAYMVSCF